MADTALSPVALAFDRAAEDYDRGFGGNAVGRLFRYLFQERLLRLFPAGSRLLDLGCGSGEDALFLAARGRSVVGVDVSPGMIERAQLAARGAPATSAPVSFEVRSAEETVGLGEAFDGAYSDFGALNCAELGAVGRGLARVLRSGAPLVLSVMGPSPLPLLVAHALTGRGEARGARDPQVGGTPVPTRYPSPARVRRALGPEFEWNRGFSLGALLPDPSHVAWALRHPQAFGVLAALESVVRAWPLLRALGDHNVVEGRRR